MSMDFRCVESDPGARSSTTLQSPQRHHRSDAGNAVALGADNCRALAALACTLLAPSCSEAAPGCEHRSDSAVAENLPTGDLHHCTCGDDAVGQGLQL